ncbi:phosphatase PAP2 family protein [Falsiroseomonas sp. E2-1-a4]|uniref:phosphatase PAP2 family protein n=1 Tax=Falsiroseomonas sp. E2-1-a4 TaxID=3239299 RepID=UPI003F3F62E1
MTARAPLHLHLWHRFSASLSSVGERLELGTVTLLLLLASATWGFIELSDAVFDGKTVETDRALLLALRSSADPADPLGPGWLEEMGRDVTALGGVAVLVLLILAVTVFMALRRLWHAAALLLAAVGSGILVSTVLKAVFERPRPDLVPHGSYVATASFPSGHSMMAAVVYLTLGALLARVEPDLRVKIFVLSAAVLLTMLVGISRVYLGVHWPTDVLAGWTVGAGWALLVWLTARALQRQGRIETDTGG